MTIDIISTKHAHIQLTIDIISTKHVHMQLTIDIISTKHVHMQLTIDIISTKHAHMQLTIDTISTKHAHMQLTIDIISTKHAHIQLYLPINHATNQQLNQSSCKGLATGGTFQHTGGSTRAISGHPVVSDNKLLYYFINHFVKPGNTNLLFTSRYRYLFIISHDKFATVLF